MANKNPVKKFKKGAIEPSLAGQKSSRAIPPDLKEARMVNANKFEHVIYQYMGSTIDVLRAKLKDETTPAMDLVVIRILVLAIEKGDHARLNFLLERTIGKVADRMELKAAVLSKTLHEQIMDAIDEDENKSS